MDITIRLDGPDGRIDTRTLIGAVEIMLDLLESAGNSPKFGASWVPTALSVGSLAMVLTPADETDSQVVPLILGGLATLEHSPAIPKGFTESMLKSVRGLHRIAERGGATGVSLKSSIGTQTINAAIDSNAATALTVATESLGSVVGRLDKLNIRKRREVGLIDEATGVAITGQFPAELEDAVKALVGQRVLAFGRLQRNSAGQKSRINMRDLELAAQEPPVPVSQLRGVLGDDWKDGLDSVAFSRRARSE